MIDTTAMWPLFIALALLMGFVADRTNLCSVAAINELLFQRRATLLLSFVKVVLWVLGTSLLLQWLLSAPSASTNSFQISPVSLMGGILFGFGSVMNDGCSLHTLTRLGRGNMGMAVSIVGLIVGAIMCRSLLLQAPDLGLLPDANADATATTMEPAYRQILLWVLGIWATVETFTLLRRFKFSDCRRDIMAAEYGLSPAAALLGITNGVLFFLAGTWMYTYTLVQSTSNLLVTDSEHYSPVSPLLWWLLLAYIAGIFVSAISHHNVHLTIRPQRNWLRYFSGGALMGMGASLVPGGNDVLLLNAIPALSSHALPSYLSMLVGIAIGLLIQHRYFSHQQ